MIKNEADIIAAFTRACAGAVRRDRDRGSWFGRWHVGILSALAEANRRVEVCGWKKPSYIQSVTMTHVLRDRSQVREADWVFFLDADEFLPFEDRAAFHAALARFSGCPVVSMAWQNLIPETYRDGEVEIRPEDRFFVAPVPSPYRKIALQPARVSLEPGRGGPGQPRAFADPERVGGPGIRNRFPLLHLPVRSVPINLC